MVRKSWKKRERSVDTWPRLFFVCIHRLQAASAQDSLKLCLVVGILDSDSEGAERPAGRALEDKEEEEEEEEDDNSITRRRSLW